MTRSSNTSYKHVKWRTANSCSLTLERDDGKCQTVCLWMCLQLWHTVISKLGQRGVVLVCFSLNHDRNFPKPQGKFVLILCQPLRMTIKWNGFFSIFWTAAKFPFIEGQFFDGRKVIFCRPLQPFASILYHTVMSTKIICFKKINWGRFYPL